MMTYTKISKNRFLLALFVVSFGLPLLLISLQTKQTGTASASGTTVAFTILLDGIGKAGDSASPGAVGNTEPHYRGRTITADFYTANNSLALHKEFVVTYDDASGSFKGRMDAGTLASGSYTVKVKADRYLQNQLPGIQQITAGQLNTMSPVTLVAGDVNGDNQLNIVDFNYLMECYSDLQAATACSTQQKIYSDLTDDTIVNQFDYNLFIREIGNRSGTQ
jgi:hypothetical protein